MKICRSNRFFPILDCTFFKMPVSSLPNECFNNVLSFLDRKSLYKCLFVNRYYCKFAIPLIWEESFFRLMHTNSLLINTLLSCLNEDEISSLIPCAIKFNNDQSPLFEYGKFVRKFNHNSCVIHIHALLKLSYYEVDCRVQKLVNVIYHMIMRQGSNLQEFDIGRYDVSYTALPKLSIFTTYEPGITNLRTLKLSFVGYGEVENAIEFLNMISKS